MVFHDGKSTGVYATEAITALGAEEDGFVNRYSCVHSLRQVAEIYKHVHPDAVVRLVDNASVDALEEKAMQERQRWGRAQYRKYHRLFFQLFTVKGTWNLGPSDIGRYPGIKGTTSMEQILIDDPEI